MKETSTTTQLEKIAERYNIYTARRPEYAIDKKIPFRVSPTPFSLNKVQAKEIYDIGEDITNYFKIIDSLYHNDDTVKKILDTGKPEIFLLERPSQYLFIRPDLIITSAGFSVCEIETSPFGLGLAEMLNQTYINQKFETMVPEHTLAKHIQAHTPIKGTIIYSKKTASYEGQLTFLADKIFSNHTRKWKSQKINENTNIEPYETLYRGIYLSEYMTDPSIKLLLNTPINNSNKFLPSLTPHLEEKAILSFLWDKRFEQKLQKELGDAAFNHLRQVIPPTWIVGQEEFFSPGLPNGISTSLDLASLSKSKRTLVLKESGFREKSSWAEGVTFLHKKSSKTARKLLKEAQDTKKSLFIIQQFTKAINIPMQYETPNGDIYTTQNSRVRITPYFSMVEGNLGKLIGIKATGCENTDFIHGSSSSINTAVRTT
jgi:hypothetical protein